MAELTAEHEIFCQKYLEDSNATTSYLAAYPLVKKSTAGTEGHKLLKKPKILQRIEDLRAQRIQRVEVKQDDVLRALLRIGLMDPRTMYTETGALKEPKDWPDAIAACIASIEVFEERDERGNKIGDTTKVKFWPKVQSLELLGKYLKLFTDKREITLSKTLEDLVAGSWGEKE